MKSIKEIFASFVHKKKEQKSIIQENTCNENSIKEETYIEHKTNPFSLPILILVGIGWMLWGKEPQGGANIGEIEEFYY